MIYNQYIYAYICIYILIIYKCINLKSEKSLTEPVEFRGEFSHVRRIMMFVVNWWVAPTEIEVLISIDLENWMQVPIYISCICIYSYQSLISMLHIL